MRQADIDDGIKDGLTTAEQAEIVQLRRQNAAARDGERDPSSGGGLLRQGRAPKMTFPLVQDLAAERIPVRLTCGVLGFSPQAYYKWQTEPDHRPGLGRRAHDQRAGRRHGEDPEFGYRFIVDELDADGHAGRRGSGYRLCRSSGSGRPPPRRVAASSGKTPGPAVHDDLVKRKFFAWAPNVLWLTDITEHPTVEGKLYCCASRICSPTGSWATPSTTG